MEERRALIAGVDGSDASVDALVWAFGEAKARDLGVEVVHAWLPGFTLSPTGSPCREDAAVTEANAKVLLDEQIAAAEARTSVRPRSLQRTVQRGAAATVLAEVAADRGAELVVGSHGLGVVAGALMGSVSDRCLREVGIPVTVVPHVRRPASERRIVVGADGSECSYAALRWAVDEAAAFDLPLDVVHAWWVPPGFGTAAVPEEAKERAREDALAVLRDMVSGVVGRADRMPPDVQLHAVEGHPGPVLVQVAGNGHLVVGSHGKSGLHRLLGSVSRHTAHHAAGPVTVVTA